MITVEEVLESLCEFAPLDYQEDYDNSGFQVGNRNAKVGGVLLCLDISTDVIDEAIFSGLQLIISHHPLLFRGLKSIDIQSGNGSIIYKALQNEVSIISFHTNFDNVAHGVNEELARCLGLESTRILRPLKGRMRKLVTFCPQAYEDKVRQAMFDAGAGHIGNYDSCSFNMMGTGTFRSLEGANPFVGKLNQLHLESEMRIEVILPDFRTQSVLAALKSSHPYEEVAYDIIPLINEDSHAGAGIIGMLPEALETEIFLEHIKAILEIPVLRHSNSRRSTVQKIALCGGSGAFLIPDALRNQADVFLSSDLKYHDFADCPSQMLLVDGGHFETEVKGLNILAEYIRQKFPTFAVQISKSGMNPVKYHL